MGIVQKKKKEIGNKENLAHPLAKEHYVAKLVVISLLVFLRNDQKYISQRSTQDHFEGIATC